jgi:hypothetical protein
MNPDTCRGRFIAPIADLSALGGYSYILIILLNRIIAPSSSPAISATSDTSDTKDTSDTTDTNVTTATLATTATNLIGEKT